MLHRDFETRSHVRLKSVGAHRYAADPSTEVLCCAYAVDDEPVQLWTPGDPIPAELIEAANNPSWIVVAHNDAFETAIEQHVLAPRFGWPLVPLERHRCTMAMALAAGLPARLSAVADALELSNRKDAAGERLMHQTRKPRRARKDEDPAGFTGLMIRNGSIGSTHIASRTWKSSASSMSGWRRYRRRSKHCGS